jgi:hypothetical protein
MTVESLFPPSGRICAASLACQVCRSGGVAADRTFSPVGRNAGVVRSERPARPGSRPSFAIPADSWTGPCFGTEASGGPCSPSSLSAPCRETARFSRRLHPLFCDSPLNVGVCDRDLRRVCWRTPVAGSRRRSPDGTRREAWDDALAARAERLLVRVGDCADQAQGLPLSVSSTGHPAARLENAHPLNERREVDLNRS